MLIYSNELVFFYYYKCSIFELTILHLKKICTPTINNFDLATVFYEVLHQRFRSAAIFKQIKLKLG